MRIIKFTAENIKRLKAVDITPTGNMIEITGQNGHGKSSVLDAIYYALAGTAGIPGGVVREGEESARVRLDLGDLIVTRKFLSNGNTSLIVEAENGARFPSPQTMLDQLIGSLSFDPLAFTRMDGKQQFDELRKLVPGLFSELSELDSKVAKASEHRRDVSREVKKLEAQIAGMEPEKLNNVPTEPINVSVLTDQLIEIGKYNSDLDKRRLELNYGKEKIRDSLAQAKLNREKAHDARLDSERLLCDALRWEESAQRIEDDAIRDSEALDVSIENEEPHGTTEIREQITNAQLTNKLVDKKNKVSDLQDELLLRQQEVIAHQEVIDETAKHRQTVMANATMPVEGLSFGDSKIIYQGRDLTLASDAEKLRVSVAIAIAANPRLRVLRVKDGSLAR